MMLHARFTFPLNTQTLRKSALLGGCLFLGHAMANTEGVLNIIATNSTFKWEWVY